MLRWSAPARVRSSPTRGRGSSSRWSPPRRSSAGALLVFLPVLALDLLDWGEEGFGAINAASASAASIGAAAAVALVGVRRLSRPLAIGTVLWGVPIALAAVWDTKAGALVLFGIVGLANTIVDVSAYTMLQRAVPDAVLARVFGVLESLIYGDARARRRPRGGAGRGFRPARGARRGGRFPAGRRACWRGRGLRGSTRTPRCPSERWRCLRGVPFLAVLPAAALEALARRAMPVARSGGRGRLPAG